MAREIAWQLEFDWNFDGTYTDESSNLINADGDMRFTPSGRSVLASRGIVPSAIITLHNPDNRYSSLMSTGALYGNLQLGRGYHVPVRLSVSIDGGSNYYRILDGVAKIPQESGLTASEAATVTITCRGKEEQVLNKRISTPSEDMRTWRDNWYNESEIIAEILEDAGYTDGTDFVSQAYVDANGGSATLDPGIFTIPWAWLDDESPITECWDIAAACNGRFYAGTDGRYYYENSQHWLQNSASSSETVTEASFSKPLKPKYDDSNLYNAVVVEAQPRVLGETSVLWEPDDAIQIPASSTLTVTAKLRQPVYGTPTLNYQATTAGGIDITGDVSANTTYTSYAQRVVIDFQNDNATYAARIRQLAIVGRPITGGPTVEVEETSVEGFWNDREGRTRRVQGNPYVQTRAHANAIAEALLDSQDTPMMTFTLSGLLGDPERELGQRITINDSNVMDSGTDVYVTAIRWRLSRAAGFKQDLECVEVQPLHPFLVYHVIGTTNWGGERVFY